MTRRAVRHEGARSDEPLLLVLRSYPLVPVSLALRGQCLVSRALGSHAPVHLRSVRGPSFARGGATCFVHASASRRSREGGNPRDFVLLVGHALGPQVLRQRRNPCHAEPDPAQPLRFLQPDKSAAGEEQGRALARPAACRAEGAKARLAGCSPRLIRNALADSALRVWMV